jgi:hypothetical protein
MRRSSRRVTAHQRKRGKQFGVRGALLARQRLCGILAPLFPLDTMPRTSTTCQALTIGNLAKRWGISRDHVRQIIEDGHLEGVFSIPSAGRYGAVTKIPLASVVQAETDDWVVERKKTEYARPKAPRRRDDSGPALKHFPKLRASPEQPASGSDEVAPD